MCPYLALIAWRNVSFMLSVAQCVSTLVTAVKMEFVVRWRSGMPQQECPAEAPHPYNESGPDLV